MFDCLKVCVFAGAHLVFFVCHLKSLKAARHIVHSCALHIGLKEGAHFYDPGSRTDGTVPCVALLCVYNNIQPLIDH